MLRTSNFGQYTVVSIHHTTGYCREYAHAYAAPAHTIMDARRAARKASTSKHFGVLVLPSALPPPATLIFLCMVAQASDTGGPALFAASDRCLAVLEEDGEWHAAEVVEDGGLASDDPPLPTTSFFLKLENTDGVRRPQRQPP